MGTWPPEQATVLLDVLQKAGIEAKAKRTREGVIVTVQDDQADDAHRTLVSNMDAIAKAARSAAPPRGRPKKSTTERRGPKAPTPPADRDGAPRFGSLSRPLMILIVGLILATIVRGLMVPILVFTLAAVIYTLGKQTQANDDGG
ncbi:MAG: hypothetical protein LC679_16865 [Intrasporangiaceae bacterium]|nr:hypothetical protein [Intrasporangiaceae bacterium]